MAHVRPLSVFSRALLGSTLLLASCAQEPSEPSARFDILKAARPVPVVAAQALGLQPRVARGFDIASIDEMEMTTLTAQDFDGNPFVHINLTAPQPIGDAWAFGLTLTGEEWAGAGEDSLWSTSIVGASTARSIHSSENVGLELLRKLSSTAAAMGGASQVQRIVAATPAVFLLQDPAGQYWDISTAARMDAETLQQLQTDYANTRVGNNSPELLETLEQNWTPVLEADPLGRPPSDYDSMSLRMKDFTGEDGSLQLGRAAQALRDQGVSALNVKNNGEFQRHCWRFLWWQVCNDTREGYILSDRQSHGTTLRQRAPYMGRPGEAFSVPYCGYPLAAKQDAPVGCAPASFIGLVWRQWKDGEPFFGRPYNGEPADNDYWSNSIARDMTAPTGSLGRPRIAEYMGSCNVFTGTMTTAGRFMNGGNAFLRDQGKQSDARAPNRLRLAGTYSSIFGNLWDSYAKANILQAQIGQRNNPVIAEYWRAGFLQGHFSPVKEYRLVYWTGWVDVRVKTVDDDSGWFSLTDVWLPEVGVFHLERY
jgi:hypothetical protein